MALVVALSVLLSGCEIIPDAVNPVTWFEDDEKGAPPTAEQRDQEYPKLGTVPKRPPSLETQQSKIAEGLTADLENARYTDEKVKREAARRVAGAGGASVPRAVPPPRPVPPAPRVASVPPASAATAPPPPVARPATPQPIRPSISPPAPRTAAPPPALQRPAVSAPTPQRSVAPPQAPALRNAPAAPQSVAPPPAQAPAPQTIQPREPAPAVPALGQAIKVATIYFSDGSTKLQQRDELILREIAAAQRQTGRAVRVVGHASGRARTFDAARRHLINYQISLDRAHAVAAALLRMGIPVGKLVVEGKGDTQPIYAEYTATGEAANRRTELYLVN